MVAEVNDGLHQSSADREIDAEISRGDINAILDKGRRPLRNCGGDERPDDNAETDIGCHINRITTDNGGRHDGNSENHNEDVDRFPHRADFRAPILANGVEPGPMPAFRDIAYRALRQLNDAKLRHRLVWKICNIEVRHGGQIYPDRRKARG